MQNRKQDIDRRTDFFALGIIILELYLGFHPFDQNYVKNNNSIPENILNGQYVDALSKKQNSEVMDKLTRRLLQPQPFQRFRNSKSIRKFIKQI